MLCEPESMCPGPHYTCLTERAERANFSHGHRVGIAPRARASTIKTNSSAMFSRSSARLMSLSVWRRAHCSLRRRYPLTTKLLWMHTCANVGTFPHTACAGHDVKDMICFYRLFVTFVLSAVRRTFHYSAKKTHMVGRDS